MEVYVVLTVCVYDTHVEKCDRETFCVVIFLLKSNRRHGHVSSFWYM
jgi:hypothetical protein